MDSGMFDDLWKAIGCLILAVVVVAVPIIIGLWELAKYILNHISFN